MVAHAFLSAERAWLENQPGMTPWDKAATLLSEQLNVWVERYLERLSCPLPKAAAGPPENERETVLAAYAARAWDCWRHHWRAAIELDSKGKADGWLVADMIRDEKGVNGKSKLGGDPLRDVVLALAVLRNEPAARTLFFQDYREFALRQGGKILSRLSSDEDWWSDLVGTLAGDLEPPGKLAQFHGHCGLQSWLGTVVRYAALSVAKRDARRKTTPVSQLRAKDQDSEQVADTLTEAVTTERPDREAAATECYQMFVTLIDGAMREMQDDERLLLKLIFLDDREGQEVAKFLAIAPGNVSRRKQKAIDGLQERIARHGRRLPSYEPCVEHMFSGAERTDFAGLLASALNTHTKVSDHELSSS